VPKLLQKIADDGGSINVLILDEFAFIAPSCILGDGLITLKDTETR